MNDDAPSPEKTTWHLLDTRDIRRERQKARELRKSQWWGNRIASGVCHYCGQKVGRSELTMDHVVPLARGGRSTKGNCVPSCRSCNASKNLDTPAEMVLHPKS